jgi:hypothetical protein
LNVFKLKSIRSSSSDRRLIGRAIRAENRAAVAELRVARLEAALWDIKEEPDRAVEIANRALLAGGAYVAA